MKIGICAGAKQIAQLKKGMADYAELNLSQVYEMTNGEIKETANVLAACGVPAEAANGFFPAEVKLCGRLFDKNRVREYCKKALYNGAQLGIHTCVLGSGKARCIDEGEQKEDCIKQLEEAICIAGDAANEFCTTIVLEPLNKKETNVLNTVAEGAALCRKLHHPNVMLLADIYHVALENESLDEISKNGDILRHVHIARPEGRLYPMEHDGFDYRTVKNALDKAGYDLRISIEGASPGEFVKSAEESLQFLKSVFC